MKAVVQTPWTDEERAMLRRLRQNGLALRAIAAMMGRSFHSVQRQSRYLKLLLPVKARPAPKPAPPKRVRGATLPPLPSLRTD